MAWGNDTGGSKDTGMLNLGKKKSGNRDLIEHSFLYWVKQTWYLPLWALVIALGAVGLTTIEIPTDDADVLKVPGWVIFVLAEISVAFIVAWILIFTAERKHHKRADDDHQRRQEDLAQSIFKYIYSVNVPEELFEFIQEHILKCPIYRRAVHVRYRFERIDGTDKFKVFVTQSFTVYNLTNQPYKYTLKGTIEKPHGKPMMEHSPGLLSLSIGADELDIEKLKDAKKGATDTDNYFAVQYDVPIPANGHEDISMTYLMEKTSLDYEFWRCIDPSDSLKVEVDAPKELNIKMRAINVERKWDSYRNGTKTGTITAKISSPLLQQHGVLIWWGNDEDANKSQNGPKTTPSQEKSKRPDTKTAAKPATGRGKKTSTRTRKRMSKRTQST